MKNIIRILLISIISILLTASAVNAITLWYLDGTTLKPVDSGWSIDVSGIGDVESVGDCADGACLDGSADGGSYIRIYDGDSNYLELNPGNIANNRIINFRDAAGTVILSGDTFTGDVTATLDTDGSTALAIGAGVIIETDISGDVNPTDGDFLQYDSTGTNFTWRSGSETLSDIGAAATDQTMYIGTTAVAINRASAELNLAGIGTLGVGAITTSGNLAMGSNTISGVTTLALTGGITQAPTATGNLYDLQLENEWTTGIVMIGNYGSATTFSGDVAGIYFDFESNVTSVSKDINGFKVKLPAQTNTGDDPVVSNGFMVSGGAVDHGAGAGSSTWKGLNVAMPNITQTAGTVTSYGVYVDGGTVTSGTEYGLYVNSANSYLDGTLTVGGTLALGANNLTSTGTITGTQLDLGVATSTLGVLTLSGNTSGTVTINTAAAAGTYSLTLPTTDGGASEFLQTNGSGVLTWASGGAGDLKADGSVPLTANWDVGAFTITGTQFISDIAGGTAPFVVTSTTEVTNLRAATATALAGNGANCAAGSYALGVDASGAAESCTDATKEINSVVNGLGGTNLTCAAQSCNVDDAFLKLGGDIATAGTYDFGSASVVLEIPNAAAPTVDAAGEIAVDITTDQLIYFGGAKRVIPYFYEKGFVLEDPVAADDDVPFWHPHDNITITDCYCETQGGTSVEVIISDGTNVLETITCDANGQADDGSIANGTFTANERMEFDIGTVTGSVDWVAFTITYTIDAD